MSGPSTEDPAMPDRPDWTWPEARHLADLYMQALGAIPDSLQAHLDALERVERDRAELARDTEALHTELTRRETALRDALDDA